MNLYKNLRNFQIMHNNELVFIKFDLSLNAQKLIMILTSNIQYTDVDFQEIEFKILDLAKIFNISNPNIHKELSKITYELISKVIYFKYSNKMKKGFLQGTFLSSVEFKENEDKIIFEISPKIVPYLYPLKSLFTKYNLINPLNFKSKYSIKLYEIFKENKFTDSFEIKIDKLKENLRTQKSYSAYNNFKEKILKIALYEINKTDLYVRFEEIKTGRKVTSLKFYVTENKNNRKENNFIKTEHNIDEIKEKIYENNMIDDHIIKYLNKLFETEYISIDIMKKIINNANGDIEKIKKIYEYSKTQNIDNIIGFMLKMVKDNNFIEPKEATKQLGFINFNERQYDYDKVQKQLLGWDTDNENIDFNINNNINLKDIIQEEEKNINNSELSTLKVFLEEQLKVIFSEIKYKSWLKYSIDNLDINDENIVNIYLPNKFTLEIFENTYKDVLIELVNSINPLLKLNLIIK